MLLVESSGECSGSQDSKCLKLQLAKSYKSSFTPGAALVAMESAGIPPESTPSISQMKSQRRRIKGDSRIAAECLGAMQLFLDASPAEVEILQDHVTCTADKIRIPFHTKSAADTVKRLNLSAS